MDYASDDPAFLHLFNLDGLAAVLHASAVGDLEVWVGNGSGESAWCVRGFSVVAAWLPGTAANLTFQYLANGSVGDMLLDDNPMPPASTLDPFYFTPAAACAPVNVDFRTSKGRLWVGGSGTPWYDDTWAGTVSFVGLEYAPLSYNVSAAPQAGRKTSYCN